MSEAVNLFLPVFIQVLVLFLISQLVNRLVYNNLGRRWYLAFMWPGVVIHEFSHYLACKLTFTEVYKFRPFTPSGGQLGYVEHAKSRNPVVNMFIAMAPLFGGTVFILLLTKFIFPRFYISSTSSLEIALSDLYSYQAFFSFTGNYLVRYLGFIKELFNILDFHYWGTYLFIYFMLSVSSHISPSRQDLKNSYFGLLSIVFLFYFVVLLDRWLVADVTWYLIKVFTVPVYLAGRFLGYGIIFSFFSLIISLILYLIGKLLRSKG